MTLPRRTTRRAFAAGVLTLALLGTAACSSEGSTAPEAPGQAPSEDAAPSDGDAESVDNHGEDSDLNQDIYELVEVTGPTTITVQLSGESSEPVEVRLLGLADIKAEGESETAFASDQSIEAATEQLTSALTGADIVMTADPGAPDADEDGALLRYIDLVDAGLTDPATGEKDDVDVAMSLIKARMGVYDPALADAGLERMADYIELTRIAMDPAGDEPSEIAYFEGLENDKYGSPLFEDAELVVST